MKKLKCASSQVYVSITKFFKLWCKICKYLNAVDRQKHTNIKHHKLLTLYDSLLTKFRNDCFYVCNFTKEELSNSISLNHLCDGFLIDSHDYVHNRFSIILSKLWNQALFLVNKQTLITCSFNYLNSFRNLRMIVIDEKLNLLI